MYIMSLIELRSVPTTSIFFRLMILLETFSLILLSVLFVVTPVFATYSCTLRFRIILPRLDPPRSVSKGGGVGGCHTPQSPDTVGKTVSVGKMRKRKGENEKEEKRREKRRKRRRKKEKEGDRRRGKKKEKEKEKEERERRKRNKQEKMR